MEDIDVLDELEVSYTPRRSTFLTVICILTWVGSGLAVLYYGYQYIAFSAVRDFAKVVGGRGYQARSAMRTADIYFAWYMTILLINMIAPLFTVAGSLVMWNLRKWGFYLYAIGQLVPLGFGIWFSLTLGDGFRGISLFFTAFTSIVPLGFIVMYAVNLKDMR